MDMGIGGVGCTPGGDFAVAGLARTAVFCTQEGMIRHFKSVRLLRKRRDMSL